MERRAGLDGELVQGVAVEDTQHGGVRSVRQDVGHEGHRVPCENCWRVFQQIRLAAVRRSARSVWSGQTSAIIQRYSSSSLRSTGDRSIRCGRRLSGTAQG